MARNLLSSSANGAIWPDSRNLFAEEVFSLPPVKRYAIKLFQLENAKTHFFASILKPISTNLYILLLIRATISGLWQVLPYIVNSCNLLYVLLSTRKDIFVCKPFHFKKKNTSTTCLLPSHTPITSVILQPFHEIYSITYSILTKERTFIAMSSVDHEEVQPPAPENSSSTTKILAQSPQHESTETQNTQNDNTYRSPLTTTSKSAHSSPNSSVNQDDQELSKIASNEKKSASDSTSSKSGLVSPSSCSVSSNENIIPQSSSNQDILIQSTEKNAVKPPNVTSAMGDKVSISTTVRGNEGVQQEHITKPEVVRSINPIASLHKKVQGRERSNSVPSSLISNRTHTSPRAQPSTTSKSSNLRRGKWTAEEEAYVARVIQDFNNGHLNAPAGTTLRTYLSDKLNCDPMRITKKFTGEACIGKRVFHPAVRCPNNADVIDKDQVRIYVYIFSYKNI